jgi:two-component system, NtrC family, sensor kinase
MSLRLKMILGIGTILLAVILVYALIAVRSQATYRQDLARHQAELIAAMADRSLTRAMGFGETEVIRAILARIGEQKVLAGIRVVGVDGRILQSNRPEEVGRPLPSAPRPSGDVLLEPVWDVQDRSVAVFRPIANGTPCVGCHEADRKVLGYLNVLVSFPKGESGISHQWTIVIVAALVSLLAVGGLIALLFSLVLGRRLDALSETMSRVEGGDLSVRVEEASGDELGRLGKSFNTMVERLAEARRQLEDRHSEQIRRAQSLAALGTMAAGIAHEINNPIAGMQNCVRALLRGNWDKARLTQYLELLREGLERIGRTVGQLLNFAREAKPQVARVSLRPLLQRCLTLLEHELTNRGIATSLRLDGEVNDILGDPHQLEQVFLNVLMNAIEAMNNGGRLDIAIRERRDPRFAQVAVTDTGAGIPPEHMQRIFDPFFTTKEVGKNTGLGLSVSYGIVRTHGGYIDVESTVGVGTTVRVDLPVNGG